MELELLFSISNLFVLPFWALMIVLPNWQITQKIMKSYLIFLPLIFLYIYLFIIGFNSDAIEVLSNPQLQLTDLAKVFAIPTVTFTGWVHFLVLDLFVGRYIYWQGQEEKIWTIHSLILCLFAGPIGLFSHLTTRFIQTQLILKKSQEAL